MVRIRRSDEGDSALMVAAFMPRRLSELFSVALHAGPRCSPAIRARLDVETRNNVEVIRVLIRYGARVNESKLGRTPLFLAHFAGTGQAVRALKQAGAIDTPL